METTQRTEVTTQVHVTDVTGVEHGVEGNDHGSYWDYFTIDASDYMWQKRWVGACGGILCVGILGNCLVLYEGLRQSTIRNSPFHLLLMNHSLSCLLLALFAYPAMLYIGRIGLVETDFDSKLCHYANMFMMWWVSVGLLSNGIVAVNRAMSCFPHNTISRVVRRRRGTWATIAGVWTLFFILYAVPAFGYRTGWSVQLACLPFMEFMMNMNHSESDTVGYILRYGSGLCALVALIMSLLSYTVIIWRLFGQRCIKCGATKEKPMSVQRRREKLHAFGVIAVVFTTFIVCWIPLMWAIVWQPELLMEPIYSMLPMLETALNPILYMITMPVYRPHWLFHHNRVQPESGNSKKTYTLQITHPIRMPQVETVSPSATGL